MGILFLFHSLKIWSASFEMLALTRRIAAALSFAPFATHATIGNPLGRFARSWRGRWIEQGGRPCFWLELRSFYEEKIVSKLKGLKLTYLLYVEETILMN